MRHMSGYCSASERRDGSMRNVSSNAWQYLSSRFVLTSLRRSSRLNLTSERLANAGKELSRYHIFPRPAHTVLAQASLSILLALDDQIDRNRIMKDFPLARY